jgi:hypothetical protein
VKGPYKINWRTARGQRVKCFRCLPYTIYVIWHRRKVKGVPKKARCDPEGSRRFRMPDFHDIQHWKVVRSSPSRTGRLYPQECSWYSFSLGAEPTPAVGRKYVTEKSSDTTGNRSRDRPTVIWHNIAKVQDFRFSQQCHNRFKSSGMWLRVDLLVVTAVSVSAYSGVSSP